MFGLKMRSILITMLILGNWAIGRRTMEIYSAVKGLNIDPTSVCLAAVGSIQK